MLMLICLLHAEETSKLSPYFLASPPRPCYLQHLNNYKLIFCDVSFVDDTWKGSHWWYADYHGTWASERGHEGQAPLDFAKGCFLSFEVEKIKFHHFWPSSGKNPSDAHATAFIVQTSATSSPRSADVIAPVLFHTFFRQHVFE